MYSYDCYCALCSGPLGKGWVRFGTNETKWLTRRRRRLDLKKRKLAGEDVKINHGVDPMEDDGTDDGSKRPTFNDLIENAGAMRFGTDVIHDLEIATAFDESERVAEEEDDEDDAIQFVEDDMGSTDDVEEDCSYDRGFVSGRGIYDDYAVFYVGKPGNDLNDPKKNHYPCYTSFDSDEKASFPFHRACMYVLAKFLDLERQEDIDMDVLHMVCLQNNIDGERSLSIDYGLLNGPDKFWQCFSGEEYIVSDPSLRPEVGEVLRTILQRRFLADEPSPLNLEHKVQNDPLRALPYDILYIVLRELSFEDMRSLMQGSWYVFSSTRSNAFWKQRLAGSTLPWLWEASFLLEEESFSDTLDWRSVLLWLNTVTQPRFGMGGPFMGIANRRRIWDACQPLVAQYLEKTHPEEQLELDQSETKAILESASSLQTTLVTYPVPEAVHPVSSQFIHAWSEIKHRSSVLDTFWNSELALIGISITFSGTEARIFGSTKGRPGDQLYIPKGDWIRELIVYMADIEMFNRGQDRSHVRDASENVPRKTVHILGLTVVLSDKSSKKLRSAFGQTINRRAFVVLPNHHLIGLTGQVTENGEICHLGLLQARDPEEDSTRLSSYTEAQKLLWDIWSESVYCNTGKGYRTNIWAHPELSVILLGEGGCSNSELRSRNADIPPDMIPWHPCLWAPDLAKSESLEHISCFQPTGAAPYTEPYIAGFTAGGTEGIPWAQTGNGGAVPVQDPNWQNVTDPVKQLPYWVENLPSRFSKRSFSAMTTFKIDGAGGEIITEVHASRDMEAVKLHTNKNRVCYFGVENKEEWLHYKAEEGRVIVGLACAFGRLAGWSSSAKMHSHWVLSDLGVLTVSQEYFEGKCRS